MNRDYQALDWATVPAAFVAVAARQGRLEFERELRTGVRDDESGAHSFLRGLGKQSLFGWPTMPKVEELRSAWIDATDPGEQKRLCREIQLQAFQDVPYIPLGASSLPRRIGRI